ncbi:MAG: single-stranded-DNA-specific exonuclease RecJ [Eubacteriales bacterium]|nr:single-stranded-DNA-specific exonuclease RecJ [Eubacteriales bacterium]
MPDIIASLLYARGIENKEEAQAFLSPDASCLHDPFLLNDMDKAVEIINIAVRERKRAVIYGDYDVDGICASAILSETFSSLGLKHIIYIPDRHEEGYGLNMQAVEQLAKQADIFISVDCGITSVQEVALAKKLGMQVIITDHHTVPNEVPKAHALVSSLINNNPNKNLCGAGIAWKLSCALKSLPYAMQQLDLCALATVADMVPLLKENRVITALGLKCLSKTQRLGLIALKEVSNIADNAQVSSSDVAFRLAPRLNASGRLASAKTAVALLKSKHIAEARELASELNSLNAERKQEEQSVLNQAKESLKNLDSIDKKSIVVMGEQWNSGVIGLSAGRIAEHYSFPTVVLSCGEDGVCVGSARSAGDVNLYMALNQCKDLFLKFGGHEKAAGLSIKKENVEEFCLRFDEAVKQQLPSGDIIPTVYYDAEISLKDITLENIRLINSLEPYGIGNPEPKFLAKDIEGVSPKAVGTGAKHLKYVLKQSNHMVDAIAFNKGHLLNNIAAKSDIVFTVSINDYYGEKPQCQIDNILFGEDIFSMSAYLEQELILKDLRTLTANKYNRADVCFIKQLPEFNGSRGNLLFCRCQDTAKQLAAKFPSMDKLIVSIDDRRLFNTILANAGACDIKSPYRNVYLCDGLITESEAALIKENTANANIYALPKSAHLKQNLLALRCTVEDLREAYVQAKNFNSLDNIPWTENKKMLALLVLDELNLIKLKEDGATFSMLPVKKIHPSQSMLFSLLNKEM